MSSICFHDSRSRPPGSRLPLREISGTRGPMFSKCGMPCTSSVRANMPNSQRGRTALSHARRSDGRSGVCKPVRTLFSRLDAHLHVDGDDERVVPGALHAIDEARDHLVVARKISLEPCRRPFPPHVLERRERGAAHHHRNVAPRAAARASTRSPSYAAIEVPPIGAMPNGAS